MLALLVPVGVCVLYLVAAMLYPFLEAWATGDGRQHHLLNRPRNTPTRTAIGVAGIVFYGVLWATGGSDDLALQFALSVDGVVLFLRLAVILGPPAAFTITKRVCLGLQRMDREIVLHGYETGVISRLPGGGYVGQHKPTDRQQRWILLSDETVMPMTARPDGTGRIRRSARVRAALSRWFSEDRMLPGPHAELDAAPGRCHRAGPPEDTRSRDRREPSAPARSPER